MTPQPQQPNKEKKKGTLADLKIGSCWGKYGKKRGKK